MVWAAHGLSCEESINGFSPAPCALARGRGGPFLAVGLGRCKEVYLTLYIICLYVGRRNRLTLVGAVFKR